jgi:hypothetical protein
LRFAVKNESERKRSPELTKAKTKERKKKKKTAGMSIYRSMYEGITSGCIVPWRISTRS